MTGGHTGISYSGLALAVLAFALTRFLVAETLYTDVESFVVAGLVPLVAGLGLTVFGVALAVGAFDHEYARTVWRWSAIGTFGMALVLVSTAIHSILRGEGLTPLLESGVLVGNVLLGGAIGGAIVGDRTATYYVQRSQLARYAERTMLVNRLLRHEILNAASVVKGYASNVEEGDEEASNAIYESAEQIEATVDEVGAFASNYADTTDVAFAPSLESTLAKFEGVAEIDGPDALPEDVVVVADERLELLLTELVENAVEHGCPELASASSEAVDAGAGSDAPVTVDVDVDEHTVTVTVSDQGPGLPQAAREVLAAPTLPRYDDPSYGYGLQMVRLLVNHYDGAIDVEGEDGTTIAVTLHRTAPDSGTPLGLGVPVQDLYRVGVASIVAGAVMGLFLGVAADLLPVIGTLYSVESAVIGWTTHLFHSVVFGLLFAAAAGTRWVKSHASSLLGSTGLGVAWGIVLWAVAAGLVMPIWLRVVGIQAAVPNLTVLGLAAHVLWGGALGALYHALPTPAELRSKILGWIPV